MTLSRRKSFGRLPRSVEMITQRPVIGSFRNSGKANLLDKVQDRARKAPILSSDCTASGGAEKRSGGFFCGILHLGAESVLMESDDWRLAGGIVDGNDVEPAGALVDAAF